MNMNNVNSRIITTRTARQWLGDDGIGRRVNLPNSKESLSDAIENIAACAELCGGSKTLALIDCRGMSSISREAREYYAGEEASKITKACAILVDSPLTRLIGNFFMRVNRTTYPIKLFTSEKDALIWLRGI